MLQHLHIASLRIPSSPNERPSRYNLYKLACWFFIVVIPVLLTRNNSQLYKPTRPQCPLIAEVAPPALGMVIRLVSRKQLSAPKLYSDDNNLPYSVLTTPDLFGYHLIYGSGLEFLPQRSYHLWINTKERSHWHARTFRLIKIIQLKSNIAKVLAPRGIEEILMHSATKTLPSRLR